MLIDVVTRAQQLRDEIPHLVQPSQADYDRVCLLTEVETPRAEVSALRTRSEAAERERDEAKGEHCKDCCCAQSWKALGVTGYTGKSIPEHIEGLRAELARKDESLEEIANLFPNVNTLVLATARGIAREAK